MELAAARGRQPGLNRDSGSEPRSPHIEWYLNGIKEQSLLRWVQTEKELVFTVLCHCLPLNLSNSPFKKQVRTHHTPVLTVYSMVPWGFWETIFFSFFSLVLFWLSSKEKKKNQVIDCQDVYLSACFERDLQYGQIAAVKNKRTH